MRRLTQSAGIGIPDVGGKHAHRTLAVPYISQLPYQQLCWAACCAMVLTANGRRTSLPQAAVMVLGNPPSDSPEEPGDCLTRVGLGHLVPPVAGGAPLTQQSLYQQVIDGCKPAEIYWRYPDGKGHVGLVTGFDPASGTWLLLDPLQGEAWVQYEYLLQYRQSANWYNTFYAIGGELDFET